MFKQKGTPSTVWATKLGLKKKKYLWHEGTLHCYLFLNVEIIKSDCALKIHFSWSWNMLLCCHRRGFLIIYKHQDKNISQINLIQPGRQESLQGDTILWFWLKKSENDPAIIYAKSKTNNGSASTWNKKCKGGNILRCHLWYFSWL